MIDVHGNHSSYFLATPTIVTPNSGQTSTPARTTDHAEPQRQRDRAQHGNMTPEQISAKRARDRERYANMTAQQRQTIRDRQNRRYAARRTTPYQNSIMGSDVTDTTHASEVVS